MPTAGQVFLNIPEAVEPTKAMGDVQVLPVNMFKAKVDNIYRVRSYRVHQEEGCGICQGNNHILHIGLALYMLLLNHHFP